ncbi:MAG: hypothetical protein SynsKO_43020 [Synoicihabitans sp.]
MPGFFMKTRTEVVCALLALLIGIIVIILGKHQPDAYYQAIMGSAGITLIGLSLAIVIVNYYLDKKNKVRALTALFELVGPSLHRLTNTLVKIAHDEFGQTGFDEITDNYQRGDWKPTSLSREQRNKLYELLKSNKNDLSKIVSEMDEALKEFCSVVGWSFDSTILFRAFTCRASISKLKRVNYDDTDEEVKVVCELYLDIALHSNGIYKKLSPY